MCQPKSGVPVGSRRLTLAASVIVILTLGPLTAAGADDVRNVRNRGALTPIKHLIVLVGENHSFDNVFATYEPKRGQRISNPLSSGIVNADGSPGPNAPQAVQFKANTPLPSAYFMGTGFTKTDYSPFLPNPQLGNAPNDAISLAELISNPIGVQPPFDPTISDAQIELLGSSLEASDLFLLRTGATGAAATTGPDTRVANYATLPNTVFQLTGPRLPYDSYTGDLVHRFYQMWQQSDCSVDNAVRGNPSGCLSDLYPYVGSEGGLNSGANSMGFLNMHQGDVPALKQLADQYTSSDNFHQAIMGGTGANHVALGTGDAMFWESFNGVAMPPAASIANPDPQSPSSDRYKNNREWSNCSDSSQPGVSAIVDYLSTLPYHPDHNCETGHFYLLNNLSPGFLPNGAINTTGIFGGSAAPPSSLRTIGDALNEAGISWAYYAGGYDAALRVANGSMDPFDLFVAFKYCNICNFESYVSSIMANPAERSAHIKDLLDFLAALEDGNLPTVSFVKPDALVDGHPASSKLDLFEAMLTNIVDKLTSNPVLFKDTALFVTFDESGGYWDSGYIQPLDFFGDGPRIPFIVVSRYSRGGKVIHSYNDLVSVLKFIERNWRLAPLTRRSRDNLPNPASAANNPYVPFNAPAIGDLLDMFDFDHRDHDDDQDDHD